MQFCKNCNDDLSHGTQLALPPAGDIRQCLDTGLGVKTGGRRGGGWDEGGGATGV